MIHAGLNNLYNFSIISLVDKGKGKGKVGEIYIADQKAYVYNAAFFAPLNRFTHRDNLLLICLSMNQVTG